MVVAALALTLLLDLVPWWFLAALHAWRLPLSLGPEVPIGVHSPGSPAWVLSAACPVSEVLALVELTLVRMPVRESKP